MGGWVGVNFLLILSGSPWAQALRYGKTWQGRASLVLFCSPGGVGEGAIFTLSTHSPHWAGLAPAGRLEEVVPRPQE